jgi:anaerobic dimethyl sulfoxide reductase subunit A
MDGVTRAYSGGWYDPDEDGVDRGGCVNVLINDDLTANDGVPNFNTCLVEVVKDDKVRDVIQY